MAVTQELFTERANAGKAGRSKAKRPTSSAAICCASAALPPFPNRITLFPCCNDATKISLTLPIVATSSELPSMVCFVARETLINSVTRWPNSPVSFIPPPHRSLVEEPNPHASSICRLRFRTCKPFASTAKQAQDTAYAGISAASHHYDGEVSLRGPHHKADRRVLALARSLLECLYR